MRKPVSKENCTEIGYVKKTHGVKGELQVFYQEGIEEILDDLEFIFFEYEGLLVPFFIDSIFSSGANSAVILFKTLDSKEKATEYAGCKLFIDTCLLLEEEASYSPQLLIGFTVSDVQIGKIGEISVIEDFGGNIVFTVLVKGKEILIPFHDELLVEFNPAKKLIVLDCPEGLLELNVD
jgi:16S rRNA processing protein RimM